MANKVFSLTLANAKWMLFFSYLLVLVLDTMISLSELNLFLPLITFLVLMFWVTQLLSQTHLITAFILGLFFDTTLSTPLGSHALIFVILTFLMLRFRLRFKSFPIWQQGLIIGGYLLLFQAIGWFIFSPPLAGNDLIFYWLEAAVGALLWPLVVLIMQSLTRRFVY